jgi:hypothetical protein
LLDGGELLVAAFALTPAERLSVMRSRHRYAAARVVTVRAVDAYLVVFVGHFFNLLLAVQAEASNN